MSSSELERVKHLLVPLPARPPSASVTLKSSSPNETYISPRWLLHVQHVSVTVAHCYGIELYPGPSTQRSEIRLYVACDPFLF